MTWILGLVVIAGGVVAVYRRVDVRLALLATALVLGIIAGDAASVVKTFFITFADERFVVPICASMGFAYVVKLAQCDQHLVHLLVKPLTRIRPLLVPGTVVVCFLVNIPIISQTSTAVTVGAVIVPILLAARIPLVTIGAALLLGSSIGGELLNPGAPELRTIVVESTREAEKMQLSLPGRPDALVARLLPLNLLGLAVATAVFWAMSALGKRTEAEPPAAPPPEFRVNLFKAVIPVLPLVLLFLCSPPLKLVKVPPTWLVTPKAATLAEPELTPEEQGLFDSRLIGAAMLIGAVVAALSAGSIGWQGAASFFEGAGYGFTHIISLIVAAACLGTGVKQIGLGEALGSVIQTWPMMLIPAAGVLPLGFGVLCGSGMASTQALFTFFAKPSLQLGIDPYLVGSVVGLAAAAGRTMSPFAAVTLMSSTLAGTSPMQLVVRVAPPLLAAVAVEVAAAMVMAAW